MQMRKLGNSDLQIPRVAYGGWAIGGSALPKDNLALVERMREIANNHDRFVGEVAIAWTLHHPAVTGAIVGARNARQAEEVMRAAELHLIEEEVNEIEAFAETAA